MTRTSSPTGTNALRSRSSNRQAVLGKIHSAGQMGRAEIGRALGLSTQAVSNIIAELEGDGLLVEDGPRISGRGLPAMQYSVNPSGGYALGVEIRPDAIFTALLNLKGEQVATRRRSIHQHKPKKVLNAVTKLLADMKAKAGVAENRLLGAGIVMPGPFGKTGLSGVGLDLSGWQSVDAAEMFEDALGLPVALSNDANAAAMAERIGGAAQGLTEYAYLYFGAGLGLGLVQRAQLVTGAFGNAGEIGQVHVVSSRGTAPLEGLVSRVAVQRCLGGAALEIADLDRLYAASDPKLMGWLNEASRALSQAVGMIENLFDPQTIIMGGAMPISMVDHLVAETELPALSVSNREGATLPRLQRGKCGRLTATLGAASLILNRVFTPQTSPI